jgi:hypothetical protein
VGARFKAIKGSTFQKDVEKALPNTDQATRHIVRTRLLRCFRMAFHAEGAFNAIQTLTERTRHPEQWEPDALAEVHNEIHRMRERFGEMRLGFGKALDDLEAEIRAFKKKIDLYEARAARIRKRIEAYFDEE